MWHDVTTIAKNYGFDPDDFKTFAINHSNLFCILQDGGLVQVSTLNSDALVKAYMVKQDELNDKWRAANGDVF